MKKCPKCKHEKPLTEFYPRNKQKPELGVGGHCKKCHNLSGRNRYKRNPTPVLIRTKQRRNERIVLINRAKDKPCMDCGIQYPHYVMEFDHAAKNKCFNIGNGRNCYSLIKLQEEIEKCEVVCANCHRERTYGNK